MIRYLPEEAESDLRDAEWPEAEIPFRVVQCMADDYAFQNNWPHAVHAWGRWHSNGYRKGDVISFPDDETVRVQGEFRREVAPLLGTVRLH